MDDFGNPDPVDLLSAENLPVNTLPTEAQDTLTQAAQAFSGSLAQPPSLATGTGGESQFDYQQDPLLAAAQEQGLQRSAYNPRPRMTKGDFFKQALSNFMFSFATGMKEAGTGPGANARGFGAAALAPFHRQIQRQQMDIERRRVGAQEESARSLAAMRESEMQPITVTSPDGKETRTLPARLAMQYQLGGWRLTGQLAGVAQRGMAANQNIVMQMRKLGLKANPEHDPSDPNSAPFIPLTKQEMTQQEQAKLSLTQAQDELAKMRAKGLSPDSPQMKMQIARLGYLQASLGMRQSALEMSRERLDFLKDKARGVYPTANVQTRGQVAHQVIEHTEEIRGLIAQLDAEDKLGPIAGRFEDFMAGKIGAGDPEFVELRTMLGMFKSGAVMAHFGARGGIQMLNYFKDLLDVGKFTPESLDAAVNGINKYLETYAAAVPAPPGTQGKPAAGRKEPPRPANVPKGWVFKENGPKGRGWYKP